MGVEYAKTKLARYRLPMRCLILDNVEKYRMVVGRTLIYAKGKINFNLNNTYKDSNNEERESVSLNPYSLSYREFPTELFAFYGEGFYKYRKRSEPNNYTYTDGDEYARYRYDNLSSMINNAINLASGQWLFPFEGWFLSPVPVKGEKPIDSIQDVYKYTDLFDNKIDDTLPEITLYARWHIPTFKIKIYNIGRYSQTMSKDKKVYSSFIDKKTNKRIIDDSPFSIEEKVYYGTDIRKYLQSKIKDVKYITWAKNALDNTNNKKALRAGPQKLIGWDVQWSEDYTGLNDNTWHWFRDGMTVKVYPHFQSIAIWKKYKLPKGTYYYINPGEENEKKVVLKKDTFVGGTYSLDKIGDHFNAMNYCMPNFNLNLPMEYFSKDNKIRYIWILEKWDYVSQSQGGSGKTQPSRRSQLPSSPTLVYALKAYPTDWNN